MKLPPKVATITFDEGINQDYEMNIFKGTRITIKVVDGFTSIRPNENYTFSIEGLIMICREYYDKANKS